MKTGSLFLIIVYQKVIARWLPTTCRFQPSCSQYCYQAIAKYGFVKGMFFFGRRIVRCHPFGNMGYDPVP
ncbi:membrane protein insertion efficiency factor YidD [SAR202 cluster bacterium AC-409-J13_OGT_754m]|nr:membrane protein insertion efficiency factor YidD [SAR202 cluster bacterium AC-409-J13_OGT_754m]